MEIFDSFSSFMTHVKNLEREHPDWTRLDGETEGNSRKAFAYFRRDNKLWKVDEDTHFEPLNLALDAEREGEDPFDQRPTSRSTKRFCLELKSKIRSRQKSRAKYLYIYAS
jgi:hypothetical protein